MAWGWVCEPPRFECQKRYQINAMQSKLSWDDHASKARGRTLCILSLFQEKESRDDLGLGAYTPFIDTQN